MYRIEVDVSLSMSADGPPPEVRLWVDLDHERGLHTEVELSLQPVHRLAWRALFEVDPGCEHFSYRLGLCAHADAQWWLRFREVETGTELLADGDRLVLPKHWSLGTCMLNAAAVTRPATSRTSSLLLLRHRDPDRGSEPP